MIVVDASALVESLLRLPAASRIDERMFAAGETLHAPHFIDVEIAQVVRRFHAAGEIDAERGRNALAFLIEFPLRRYRHTALLPRMWELRNNLTAYDAAYIALAEALDAPLLTRDRKIAAAPGLSAKVEFI